MTTRRPSSLLAFSQATETSVKRRRRSTGGSHTLHTAVLTPYDGGFLSLPAPAPASQYNHKDLGPSKLALAAERFRIRMSEWRQTTTSPNPSALEFDTLWKLRDQRVELLRNLSNPWPETTSTGAHNSGAKAIILPEANPTLVPHAAFREHLAESIHHPKVIRRLIRTQLLHCERPREVLRVVACVMQNPKYIDQLAIMADELMRAMYRCRNTVSDPEVLQVLGVIIARFRFAQIPVQPELIHLAVKFAARCRSPTEMRKYLSIIRREKLRVNSDLFRSIIAKCSIGYRGLGEIRNGRWRRRDLLEVLQGFSADAHLPPSQQCHLGTFLMRETWLFLHGWVAILARCRADAAVWQEWLLWRRSTARINPRKLIYQDRQLEQTSKSRGEMWFVEQMALTGNLELAWRIFYDTDLRFGQIGERTRMAMLDAPEYVRSWDEEMRREMLRKYDLELCKIEAALGVRWAPLNPHADGEGRHEVIMDREVVLERLADVDGRAVSEYGYPWEDQPIVPESDRDLHHAIEAPWIKVKAEADPA